MIIYLYRSAVSVNELSPRVPVEVTPIAVTSEADPLEEPPVVLQEKQTGKFVCLFILLLSKAHLDFLKDSNTGSNQTIAWYNRSFSHLLA